MIKNNRFYRIIFLNIKIGLKIVVIHYLTLPAKSVNSKDTGEKIKPTGMSNYL